MRLKKEIKALTRSTQAWVVRERPLGFFFGVVFLMKQNSNLNKHVVVVGISPKSSSVAEGQQQGFLTCTPVSLNPEPFFQVLRSHTRAIPLSHHL
jgi:hypothetical protein